MLYNVNILSKIEIYFFKYDIFKLRTNHYYIIILNSIEGLQESKVRNIQIVNKARDQLHPQIMQR